MANARAFRQRISGLLMALWLFAFVAMAINGCLAMLPAAHAPVMLAVPQMTMHEHASVAVDEHGAHAAQPAPEDELCASLCDSTSVSAMGKTSLDGVPLLLLLPVLFIVLRRVPPLVPRLQRCVRARRPLLIPCSILFLRLNN